MSATTTDKVLLGAAGLLFLGSCAWAWFQETDLGDAAVVNAPTSGKPYEPEKIDTLDIETKRWPEAQPLARGKEWLFDVFTPPVIFYDAGTKAFTVTPPRGKEEIKVDPFGLDLLAVERDDFRLQLTGYSGSGDTAKGFFQNVLTQGTIIGTAGKKVPELDLEIIKFTVGKQRIAAGEGGTPMIVTAAIATVRDTKTGEETEINSAVRAKQAQSTATFRAAASGKEYKAKAGESFKDGEITYKVDILTDQPAKATVTKQKAGEEAKPETKVLEIHKPSTTSESDNADSPAGAPGKTSTPPPAGGSAFPGF
ncbi:hypothetical protein Ga0100231_017365 [Opitutaceae bacterium TAV4]|nr:hypothetical protein Ga0100231_015635 [Opitutaceae bacterium TAV4]RRJ95780.1 hypothetical protein Ga0100231_017365 [Opitutaceae bacterium TAV4]RRJ98666.1 hypothetical protein Ga0100230_009940 [Opitutaceae bacterium TAV3]